MANLYAYRNGDGIFIRLQANNTASAIAECKKIMNIGYADWIGIYSARNFDSWIYTVFAEKIDGIPEAPKSRYELPII